MKPLSLLACVGCLLAGCGDLTRPLDDRATGMSANLAPPAGPPPEWTLHEPGFQANVAATGLSNAQGVVRLGRGMLLATEWFGPDFMETAPRVSRVLPTGQIAAFADIPGSFPPRLSIVDLVHAPAQGFFTSLIFLGKIFRVTADGAVEEYVTIPAAPTFLAFDSHGRLHVNQILGDVIRVESDRTLTTVVDANPATTRLRGITFDAAGDLHVVVEEDRTTIPRTTIRRFDVDAASSLPIPLAMGTLITDALPVSPPNEPLQDLVLWPAGGGDLFTVDAQNVYRVRADGTVSVFISGLVRGTTRLAVNALALSASGELLVTEFPIGRITEVRRH